MDSTQSPVEVRYLEFQEGPGSMVSVFPATAIRILGSIQSPERR